MRWQSKNEVKINAERGGKSPQKEESMTLANMAKTIRQETGMSQKQLAEMIGSNQTEVSFIERGFIPPRARKANRNTENF